MRLRFDLVAETAPEFQSAVVAASERRRGAINDAVLGIIRSSSIDEITDPRLAAIKSRMTEAARPLLGEGRIRQLVLNKIIAESI
jgi:hypothetical protein